MFVTKQRVLVTEQKVLQSKVSSFEPELIKSLPKEHLFVANKCLFAMEKGLFALNKHSFATKETFDRRKQMFVGDEESLVLIVMSFDGASAILCRNHQTHERHKKNSSRAFALRQRLLLSGRSSGG